jgi:pimeloyl-ACP methyl ester carboxylesterase
MAINKEWEEHYVTLDDITLHVMTTGMGRPIILIHGFPDFWYAWNNVVPLLKNEFKLIIPDMRGYNKSDKPGALQEYTMNKLVDDILGLAKHFKLDKFYLVGHDWGGVSAWIFAEKYPNMLKKLMIINAPHPKIFQEKLRTDKAQQKASFYIFRFMKEGGAFLKENDYFWLKKAVFEGTYKKDAFSEKDKVKYLEAWSQPNALMSGVNYYLANTNFNEWTGKISVPTIVLHGMKDTAVLSSVLDDLPEYVPHLKVIRILEASHWVMFDAPEIVATIIRTELT